MEFFDFCDNINERTFQIPAKPNAMKKLVILSLTLLSFPLLLSGQLPGDLVISEYMANPEEVPNERGEYIELYNTTWYAVNLNGCIIQDNSNLYIAPATDVYINPGEFAVVGAVDVPYAHYYYPGSPPPFSLNNMGGDQISVTCNGTLIAATSYAANQPAGTSMELAATHLHNNGVTQEGHYMPSSTPFRYNGVTRTDYGSPGHAGNTFVLPVELAGFEGRAMGRQIILSWKTLTETNNSHFVVEHSTDGKPFLPIGRLSGAGTTQEPREYRFLHDEPEAGVNYYRLQQVDFDGSATNSGIVAVEMEFPGAPLHLYPTAVDNTLTIEWQQAPRAPLALTIFDLNGRVASSLEISTEGRHAQLSVGHLPPGTYVLSVPGRGNAQQARFFKK